MKAEFAIEVPVRVWEEIPAQGDRGPGGRMVTKRLDRWVVEVDVDLERLADLLGPRAVRSAGGKAVEAGGRVAVRRLRRLGAEEVEA